LNTVTKIAAAALALLAGSLPAPAQSWPSRSLSMVVPFAAGGSTDAIARILAEGLRNELGQPVIVENVGGAGGTTGALRVARAAPDGYQFVLGNVGTHAQAQSLYRKPPYDAATDFAPVTLVTDQAFALVTRKDLPADDLRQFIAYAKADQGKMLFGSAGAGGSNHLACVLLNAAIGINATHVPYRSGAHAMQDLISGRIDYQCPSAPVALPQIVAHTVKALAILSRNRSPNMPGLASAHEQGLSGFDIPSWYAVFLPKDAPAAIVSRLHAATIAALDTPSIQERLEQIGCDRISPERRSPAYLRKFVASEIEKYAGAIKASGISID
jgi:tripartite-type tricarboxylate transporter receptor subunit TctC